MTAATLARALPASAARRWRSLPRRTRVGLALLAVALPVVAWAFLRLWPVDWPARVVLADPSIAWPLAFSPDGRTLLTYNENGIATWDASSGRKGDTWAKDGSVLMGAYSPDGRTFAAAIFHDSDPPTIELIDTTTGRSRATLKTRHRTLSAVVFDEEGRTVRAYPSEMDGLREAVTWDASTGQQISTCRISAPTKKSNWTISPDGRLLAVVPLWSNAVQLWDLEADRPIGQLPEPAGVATYGAVVAFSADGRTLAAGRRDGAIDLWDVPGRRFLKTLPAHSGGYRSEQIRLSPDGQTLASKADKYGPRSTLDRVYDELYMRGFADRRMPEPEVIVVDLATGRRIARAPSTWGMLFSPDGRTLATSQETKVTSKDGSFWHERSVRLRDLPERPAAKEARP
jgi:WD40 repeat protein